VCVTSGNANVLAQDSKKHEERVKGNRDPFVKWKPPAPVKKEAIGVISVPSLEVRINQFKALKAAAMSSQQPASSGVSERRAINARVSSSTAASRESSAIPGVMTGGRKW